MDDLLFFEFSIGHKPRGSCRWSSDKDYRKRIITIAHAVNYVSGLALAFGYDQALDFSLDYNKSADLWKQCSCAVCVHITAELVPNSLFVRCCTLYKILLRFGFKFS